MRFAVMVLAALVAICPNTQAAIQYVFKESEYTLAETGTADTTTVELIRTSNVASEITGETTVQISTDCPTECETMPGVYMATEGSSADYTINDSNKIITFSMSPSVTDKAVSITVHNDAIEEKREYFCLSVVDPAERGTQWSTRVIIPWNDHCVLHHSPSDGGTDENSPGYDIENPITAVEGYVGPWSHTIMPTITLEVTPQTAANGGGDGKNINIFLSNIPDTSDTLAGFDWYSIFLDNAYANDALFGTQNAPDDSFVSKSSIDTIVGMEEADDQITVDVTSTLQLDFSYASSSSATINVQRTAPTTTATALDATDTSSAINIGHLFVSAAVGKYADWKICGLVPRRLRAVDGGAIASGHVSEFHAGRAIDGVRYPNGKCFVSADDSSNKNWLRIDLGRVLHVQKVIIFPVAPVPGISDDASMDNARVYVGSCNPTDVFADTIISSRMNVCDEDILAADDGTIVEVTCAASAYGQYVYILPNVDGTPFSLCEVEVYGDEIPIDTEPKVEFTDNTFDVTEGTAQAVLTLTRSGSGNTCTYVDYHTSDIDTGGFTVIPSTKPSTVSWIGPSATPQQTINIDITQDNLCEPPEAFNVYLTDVVGANLATLCYTTVDIADDDSMTYTIVPPSSSISEGDGPLRIDVTRTGSGINQEGRASLMFTDISATSNDYANIPLQLDTFDSTTSLSQMKQGDVPIKTDECWEETEKFSVALGDLSPSTCSEQGTPLTVEIDVTDDDSKFYFQITSDTKTITLTEGSGTTDVTIKRIGTAQSKTVEFTVDRDSAESDDFSISPSSGALTFQSGDDDETITITVEDDDDVEETETFTITLRDPLGENCCNGNLEDPYRITVQITDNDAEYFWKEPSYSIDESENLLVCLERTGDTTTSQTVGITSAGISALSGVDFTPLTQIAFIPSDAGEKCAVVTIADNSVPEGVETFTLTINSGDYEIDESRRITTVTITDNDATVSWERPTYIATEGFGNSVTATITKTGNQEVSVVVSTGSGTATSGLDFTPMSTTITIPANQNSYPVTIAILDDDIDDNSETFTITLSSISSGSISSPTTTVSITDDDPPPTALPPDDDGLSGGAIAGIVVAAVVGLLVILGAVAFCIFMMGGAGAGAGAGAAAAGAAGTAGAVSAYGAQPVTSAGAYGLQNFSFGNGYGNSYGVNGYGGNKPYGFP